MRVRELLQKEIWSKRTSRKILIGFGIIVVGFIVLFAVNMNWITPPERKAGRVALPQIDALLNFNEMNDAEYDAKYRQAKGTVDRATQTALTTRDDRIALGLRIYLGMVDMDRSNNKRKVLPPKFRRDDPEIERRDEQISQQMKMVRNHLRQGLHRALD